MVIRPADAHEAVAAWQVAVALRGPVALVLSQQGLPVLAETEERAGAGLSRGAYILAEAWAAARTSSF